MSNADSTEGSSPLDQFVSVGRMQGVSEIQDALRAIVSESAIVTKHVRQ